MPMHPHIEKIKARVEKMHASIEEAEHCFLSGHLAR